jgi:hypothetical protein
MMANNYVALNSMGDKACLAIGPISELEASGSRKSPQWEFVFLHERFVDKCKTGSKSTNV